MVSHLYQVGNSGSIQASSHKHSELDVRVGLLKFAPVLASPDVHQRGWLYNYVSYSGDSVWMYADWRSDQDENTNDNLHSSHSGV